MSNFIDIFRRNRNISFVGMRDAALTLLPADRTSRNKLYQDLERGKGILDDEDHLNMYLHSFGKMHKAKLDAAFGCIRYQPFNFPPCKNLKTCFWLFYR